MKGGGGALPLHRPPARVTPPPPLWAMKPRILSYRTPTCHKQPVTAHGLAPSGIVCGHAETAQRAISRGFQDSPQPLKLGSLLHGFIVPYGPACFVAARQPLQTTQIASVFLYFSPVNYTMGSGAMRQRILGSYTPPCHTRMVITTLSSMFCLAALQRRPVRCQL